MPLTIGRERSTAAVEAAIKTEDKTMIQPLMEASVLELALPQPKYKQRGSGTAFRSPTLFPNRFSWLLAD